MSSLFKRIMQYKICKAEVRYNKLNPKNWSWKRPSFKKIILGFAFFIIFTGAVIIIIEEASYFFALNDWSSDDLSLDEESIDSTCNIQGIELHGNIITYVIPENADQNGLSTIDETPSDYIVYALQAADDDENIKGIILEIDSYGGSPIAAEEINRALRETSKPTVVMVRTAATSAAYWAAVGADIIFASASSDIGSIGVSMSYLDNSAKNTKEGLTYNSITAGKFKDYANPDKVLTEEEMALLMRDVNIINENFIKTIANDRKLEISKVKALADGSSMPGQLALDNGLIDRIGGIYEVEEYLKEKVGGEVSACW